MKLFNNHSIFKGCSKSKISYNQIRYIKRIQLENKWLSMQALTAKASVSEMRDCCLKEQLIMV